jgi:hypothetical protein
LYQSAGTLGTTDGVGVEAASGVELDAGLGEMNEPGFDGELVVAAQPTFSLTGVGCTEVGVVAVTLTGRDKYATISPVATMLTTCQPCADIEVS